MKNDLKLKIGAGVAYFEGDESLSSKLNYYPEIEVFYQKKGNSIAPLSYSQWWSSGK